jgi:hypothetical protein
MELNVPMYDTFRVARAVVPPLAYIVSRQWSEVIDVLTHHGLQISRTSEPQQLNVESYRFSDVKWACAPFEGHFLSTFKLEQVVEQRTFPAGSAVIRLNQPLAKVAIIQSVSFSPGSQCGSQALRGFSLTFCEEGCPNA